MTFVPRQISRRTAMTWAAAAVPAVVGAGLLTIRLSVSKWPHDEWPVPPGPGYGNDADLFAPAPWPDLMSQANRATLAALCDQIIPNDGVSVAASEAGVVDFIDELVSSPYESMQYFRTMVLNGIAWFDAEAASRFGKVYHLASSGQQADLFQDCFGKHARKGAGLLRKLETRIDAEPIRLAGWFLDLLYYLTVMGFYMSDAGTADLGYVGNRPQSGKYSGPTEDALDHISGVISQLGLPMPDFSR